MFESAVNLFKSFSEELDPDRLQRKFLKSLLKLQKVERGSIWIKKDDRYLCIEAVGRYGENIKGVSISADHKSIVGWVIENGKMTMAEPKTDARHYKELEEKLAVKSSLILCFPLFLRSKEVYGAVQVIDTDPEKSRLNLDEEYLSYLQDLINIGSIALGNAVLYSKQLKETQNLRDTLNRIQEEEVIVGQCAALKKSLELAESYAKTDFPVLITGESGTGKELVSNKIHKLSDRKENPFLVQNCSTIPESLLESELFGYKKGAFSGASKDKPGLFEAAHGGTVFLDEIGDMPINLQAGILRVIQNMEIKPLGDTRIKNINIRVISATNRNIKNMVADNEFRQDLFYRLSVLPLHLPPLRERKEDIPLLFNHFIKRESVKLEIDIKSIRSDAMQFLLSYHWPGNIRELENLVRYLLVSTDSDYIELQDIPFNQERTEKSFPETTRMFEDREVSADQLELRETENIQFTDLSWEEVERGYALYLLKKNNWNVTNAAKDAKLNRSTFDSRIKRLGIKNK